MAAQAVVNAAATSAPVATTGPSPEPADAPDASPSASSKPAKAESSDVSRVNFTMPNFVGMTLQDAQNKVQEHGIFFSASHDLLASRSQFLDSNWKVCNQTPKVGSLVKGDAIDFEGKFDFGSVKLTEDCPS